MKGARGSHATLLALLDAQFGPGKLRVDNAVWDGHSLAPDDLHEILIEAGALTGDETPEQKKQVIHQAVETAGSRYLTRREYIRSISTLRELRYVVWRTRSGPFS